MSATPELGAHFRALRLARGLSLAQVGKATAISSSFLSLFETGKTDITFGRLVRLIAFFGISITDIVPDPEPEQPLVVRSRRGRRLKSGSEHAAIELLTHHTHHTMMPVYVTLEPNGALHATSTPAGGEFFLYLLRGTIAIEETGDATIRLGKGDAAYLATDRQRVIRNIGTAQAEWLAVQTPTTL